MDGDAFFVGCEMAEYPELRGKAVVTGGERGIVTALSYEAKALGVTRGLPIFQLKKLFPSVIVRPGDYQVYASYSQKMFDVVRRYSDDVEEYSIDECFADLSGMRSMLKMSYTEILQQIKNDIKNELAITVSLGLAPNKVLAKIASKFQKPDGLTEIPTDKIDEFLPKVPVVSLWGVGRSTSRFLQEHGIGTAYDFKIKNKVWIEEHLSKPFFSMWQELHGEYIFIPLIQHQKIRTPLSHAPERFIQRQQIVHSSFRKSPSISKMHAAKLVDTILLQKKYHFFEMFL